MQNETTGVSMKSERVPVRWLVGWLAAWLGCLRHLGWLCHLFLLLQSFPRLFVLFATILNIFWRCLFVQQRERERECGPQAETPNTSHIWIYVMPLIGCCADADAAAAVDSDSNSHLQAPQPQTEPRPTVIH